MGKRITRDEFDDILRKGRPWAETEAELWSRIQEAQVYEPMSRAEVLSALDESLGDSVRIFSDRELDAIRALTVQQGFVVDWSEAPDYAVRAAVVWSAQDGPWHTEFHSIPRPAPKMRQKTEMEKAESWIEWKIRTHGDNEIDARESLIRRLLEGKTIDDLCRAAGIPLETTE